MLRVNTIRGAVLVAGFLAMIAGCSGEQRPFEVHFSSRNDAVVTYKGEQYRLNRFQQAQNVPFAYSFEDDGDLDLEVDGKSWDIDNPYDVDTKKKVASKEKKKAVTKKSSSSTSTTKTTKTVKTTKNQTR